jgi:hypothetical protein
LKTSDEIEYPVLEVFAHGHWEPWAIIVQPSDTAWLKAALEANWRLKPLRFRESSTAAWGGLEATFKRMQKCFNHFNN